MTIQKTYPYILIVGSIIGLLASFFLMVNTIELKQNPGAELPCNLNPFISCTNAIQSEQGEIFGFPNPLLGIISFSMLLASGVMLYFGGKARKIYWQLMNLGTLFSITFIIWFIYQSIYNFGTLCLYCMTVWTVSWPIFLYTTIWNYKEDHFKPNSFFRFLAQNHLPILISWYVIIIFLILLKFKDFFFY